MGEFAFVVSTVLASHYTQSLPMKNTTIAIACDHALYRESLSNLLEQTGYRVFIKAGDGRELIQLLEEAIFLPGVCIIDVVMPDLGGEATAREIRSKWPEVNIVAHSMDDSPKTIEKMIENGANRFVSKGDTAMLKNTLKELTSVNVS